MPRNLVILGSTGSIGRQTLEVARHFPDQVRVYGLSGWSNVALLEEQIREFHPVVVAEPACSQIREPGVEVLSGEGSIVELAGLPEVDLVVVGTAGRGGLLPSLAALRAGKLVALANKETLVMAGSVIRGELETGKGQLVPIDSEHSAIWQCLQGEPTQEIAHLTLTASGGALRDLPTGELKGVTPEQALRHPTWSMGRKITVDSANLMNKGLEMIEARWLFDVGLAQVNVVLHAESIVHSLVTFRDGSTKAQLGLPDMRLPIQYALSHPDRWANALPQLDLTSIGSLAFGAVDHDRYPCLRLAMMAGHSGGTNPAVLSAADEVAVEAFLNGHISFTAIPEVIEETLSRHNSCADPSLADILGADEWARHVAARLCRP